ncbi:MAG: hypothetical protein ABMA25_04725 [Ilumatobacteraceae bacterium]
MGDVPDLMRTSTRNLLCVGTALASLAVGIVGARAIHGSDDSTPVAAGAFDAPIVVQGDPAANAQQSVPVVAPVAIGDDPAILDQLIDGPPSIPADAPGPEIGRPGSDTPAIGVITGPELFAPTVDGTEPTGTAAPADDASDDEPIVYDPALPGIIPLPESAFDTCAGEARDTPPGEGCPEGYGGTVFADRLAPDPFMFGMVSHYLTAPAGDFPVTCPTGTPAAGAGQTALTVFSETPLDYLLVQWRHYGTTEVWQSLLVEPATLPDQRAAWFARFEAEPYSRDTFGMVPRCLVIDRDPNAAYEVQLTATDAFGREVEANRTFTLPDATPNGRPPTTARVFGVQPIAQVEGWTTSAGSISYVTRIITDPADRTCGYTTIPDDRVHTVDGQVPTPAGVYDLRYRRKVVTTIELPPGGMVLLCATIYDSLNRLRPLGSDTLLLQAPTAQRPRITLEGFRLNDGITVNAWDLAALIQFPWETTPVEDGCGHIWQNAEELSGGVIVQAPLWSCDEAALPVDSSGYVKVPVTVSRSVHLTRTEREQRTEAWGIQIQVDRCSPACPYRPTEWYEIPVPGGGVALCGRSFWDSSTDCPQPTDGVAIIKVEYPVIIGAADRFGTSTLVASSDRPTADPTAGTPTVQLLSTTFAYSADWSNQPAAMTIVSDRAVTINSIVVTDALGGSRAECATRSATVGGAPATEFAVTVPVCAGTFLMATANVTDAAGVAHEVRIGRVFNTPTIVAGSVHTKVEFLGGDVPAFGWIYEFEAFFDRGQSPTMYGWYDWSDTRSGGTSCFDLARTTADSYSDPRIVVDGDTLEFSLRINITTTGRGGCSGDGATGLGTIELSGSFTTAQLQSGEPMILTTAPDAALQLRVTVTADWRLLPG